METTKTAVINSRPFISEISVLQPEMKIGPGLEGLRDAVKLRINVHQGSDMKRVMDDLKVLAPDVSDVSDATVFNLRCHAEPTSIGDIAAIKDISWIQQEFEIQKAKLKN